MPYIVAVRWVAKEGEAEEVARAFASSRGRPSPSRA